MVSEGFSRRLDSWKAIADYLGRDRTTVMRWEREDGLPVHRVAGAPGRSVFAYASEIDAWLAGRPNGAPDAAGTPREADAAEEPPPSTTHVTAPARAAWVMAGVALAVLLGVALWLGNRPTGRAVTRLVSTVRVDGTFLVAADGSGAELWRHEFGQPLNIDRPGALVIDDLDGDHRPEVIAAVHLRERHGGEGTGAVVVLDADGQVRWQRTLDDSVRFGEIDYGPGWFPDDAIVYRAGDAVRIAVSAHHHTWWPDVITTFDDTGRIVARFVNAGWFSRLNVSHDGRYLLAAGVNNVLGGAALAVLDARTPVGVSPSDVGGVSCANCPAGQPFRYFLAPWSTLARPAEVPYTGLVQAMPDGSFEWRAGQRAPDGGRTPEVIFTLSPAFDVLREDVNDYFRELAGAVVPAPRVRVWPQSADSKPRAVR